MVVRFYVPGKPITQGSKEAFVPTYRTGAEAGEPVRRHKDDCPMGGGRSTGCGCPIMVNVVEDSKELEAWRDCVRMVARSKMGRKDLLDGCLIAGFTFDLKRPKNHYGSGANERVLRRGAPAAPCVIPDVGKLARAVEDAMTGIVYTDDSRIVTRYDAKRYVHNWESPGVHVTVAAAQMQTAGDLIDVGAIPSPEEELGQLSLLDALSG